MDCHEIHNNLVIPNIINIEELEKKANKTIEFPRLATTTGNAIALFTMLLLQEIIEELAINPISNVTTITQVSNSIASLNSSIKLVQ